jgi:hypothetical protein
MNDRSKRPRRALLASAAAGTFALIGVVLIWLVAIGAVHDQQLEMRERAEQALAGQAATLAETVSHEFQMIDQSLMILQAAWKLDSDRVELARWRETMPALVAVADDVFIADDSHIVRQDIVPEAVGQSLGGGNLWFPHGVLESVAGGVDARQFLMYVVRPLDHPRGWLVGASFRSAELARLFGQAALGFDPAAALVEAQSGTVEAIVGPAARRPRTDLAGTPVFAAMQRDSAGGWIGQSGVDEVVRLHAFHRVEDRGLIVMVAQSWAEVMAPVDAQAAVTRALAGVASLLVVCCAGLLVWALALVRARRRLERRWARARQEIERLRT